MSRIYFHSKQGTVQVSGSERAHARILCRDLLFVAMGIGDTTRSGPYRALLPPGSYPLRESDDAQFFTNLRTYFHGFGDPVFTLPTGEEIELWHAALNTAVAMGSDAMRLLAKLDAQCEMHCYVEGSHRAWLASIIEQGIKDNILRTYQGLISDEDGWQAVIALLRTSDDGPVVTSYSVTDQFPNRHVAQDGGWKPSDQELHTFLEKWESYDTDANDNVVSDYWYSLPESEQWLYAMAGLRKNNEVGHLEIHPDTLGTQGYGNGLSGFDIAAAIYGREG